MADMRMTGNEMAAKRTADKKTRGTSVAEKKIADKKMTGKKIADKKMTGKKMTGTKMLDKKMTGTKVTGKRTDEKNPNRWTAKNGEKMSEDKSGKISENRYGKLSGNKAEKPLEDKGWKTGGKKDKKYSESRDFKATDEKRRKTSEFTSESSHRTSSGDQAGKTSKNKADRWQEDKAKERLHGSSGKASDSRGGRKSGNRWEEGGEGNYRQDNRIQASKVRLPKSQCPVFSRCGGCQLLDMPYKKQLEQKQMQLETLLNPYCKVQPVIGMENPYHYRNKVHAVFDHDRKGNPICGVYEANTHEVVPVENCLIEDEKSGEIIQTIRGMLKSFKIKTYDEDTGYGLLRHVLVRRGFATGEIMVVLVTASPIFPSKNNFVKALRQRHPEITTIIQNVNDRDTSMVLGDKEQVLYGKGYIEDILCGFRFRISSKSFYQVNPVQTEVLYQKAIEAAGLTGSEKVIDAYCGIGTIGIAASRYAGEVIGVELNRDAVKDAVQNAKVNGIKNVKFYCNDAGKFMIDMAEAGETADVVFMDPPRSGSSEEFIDAVARMKPAKVVYVSCNPETLARDLAVFEKRGYAARMGWGVDMFPETKHCEVCVELCRK